MGMMDKNSVFFGYLGNNAEISHVGLVDINMGVKHNATSTGFIVVLGGFVGINAGIISNSYITGNVFLETNLYNATSGGLAGTNSATGTISNSYATGNVSVSASAIINVGGLVGVNSGTTSNSYATGDVSSSSSTSNYSGGLTGISSATGTTSNSYATGNVSADSTNGNAYGGGLLGYLSSGTIISNSYATGTVSSTSTSGTAYSGGLLGGLYNGTISGTNYFVDSSGTNGIGSVTCSSGTCVQKTLAELQALTSVTDWSNDDWDFGTTTQLPRVKYAPTATYCSDDTYTTQETCEDASETWVIEGCGGDTGVTCGDVIPGQ